MNNVSMGGMNAMGGPVGGGMPMMNNGAAPGGLRQMPVNADRDQHAQLNTYIYEYFLRNDMWDCARAILNSNQPLNVLGKSPGQTNEGDDGGEDSKDDIDSKRPSDLPLPNVPKECPESCFLYEWWCLFWDMFNAQRNKGDKSLAANYVTHTQTQSRQRQDQQQAMLRGIKGGDMSGMPQYQQMMMRNQQGLNMQQTNELRQKAIQNNRNGTPQQIQQMQMLAKQQQQQMQRDPSDGNNQQRAQSPGSAENAPSPSKRPRLDGPFNQQQQMPNGGRGQSQGMPQQVGETGPSNAIQAAHLQLTNGIEPNNLTAQQFQNANSAQARSLAGYQASLSQQQAGQMPGKPGMPGGPGGPQNQGSPMMTGPNNGIADYYNPDMAANGMRGGGGNGGGPGGQTNGGGNHALQDYQMQLMLLEQQNKKRLMMARQEQDNMTTVGRPDGPGGPGGPAMGPNGQVFQGASPQGPRSVNSPNPSEQMKRGTPHMQPGGMPSPVPEGQNRGSPSGMNFNLPGGGMDPSMDPKFYQMNGMNPNMVQGGGMPNGMRPPSSHPGGGFNNPMAQQQMMAARQQQGGQWQGPNGQMVPQPNQAAPQQNMGTPRQGAMPPPSAPAANTNTNGRTQPPSPQPAAPPTPSQTNKGNPKKKGDKKGDASKRATKKGSAPNLNPGSTPSADAPTDGPTPTPATPMTPVHPAAFSKNQPNGAVQPPTNGQAAAAPVNGGMPVQQPDLNFDIGNNMPFDNFQPLGDFTQPGNGSMDVLQDFDFDSFLHQDGDVGDQFNFNDSTFLDDGGQIGAD